MYVDESGDCGTNNSKTTSFFLTGVVIHESYWHQTLNSLVDFRKEIRSTTGWRIRHEIHAQEMVNGRVSHNQNIPRNIRFLILKNFIEWIAMQDKMRIITVCVDKKNQKESSKVFERAWTALIQRFENTIKNNNFPVPENKKVPESGLVIADSTNAEELRKIIRKMRRYNPVPNQSGIGYRDLPIENIIEDPFVRNSEHSYFIQIADVCAYFARQYYDPNKVVKKQGARKYYEKLEPVILKKAKRNHPLGIVEL
jgi:hypothetical protein